MRFGMIAAAAAALVCAGQADAARYFEFQIKGQTIQTLTGDNGLPQNYIVLQDILVAFDTQASYTVGGPFLNYSVTLGNGSLNTDPQPGGNTFHIGFDPASVPLSEQLGPVAANGTIGSILCPRVSCGFERTGQLYFFAGRTSDIAPATIGITDRTTLVGLAVPEPATWAMMILGLGTVGYSMRRRRAKVSFA